MLPSGGGGGSVWALDLITPEIKSVFIFYAGRQSFPRAIAVVLETNWSSFIAAHSFGFWVFFVVTEKQDSRW